MSNLFNGCTEQILFGLAPVSQGHKVLLDPLTVPHNVTSWHHPTPFCVFEEQCASASEYIMGGRALMQRQS